MHPIVEFTDWDVQSKTTIGVQSGVNPPWPGSSRWIQGSMWMNPGPMPSSGWAPTSLDPLLWLRLESVIVMVTECWLVATRMVSVCIWNFFLNSDRIISESDLIGIWINGLVLLDSDLTGLAWSKGTHASYQQLILFDITMDTTINDSSRRFRRSLNSDY